MVVWSLHYIGPYEFEKNRYIYICETLVGVRVVVATKLEVDLFTAHVLRCDVVNLKSIRKELNVLQNM